MQEAATNSHATTLLPLAEDDTAIVVLVALVDVTLQLNNWQPVFDITKSVVPENVIMKFLNVVEVPGVHELPANVSVGRFAPVGLSPGVVW